MKKEDITEIRSHLKSIEAALASEEKNNNTWQPSWNVPEDGIYICLTESGQPFFSCPIGGHWVGKVKWWMEIPQAPKEGGAA